MRNTSFVSVTPFFMNQICIWGLPTTFFLFMPISYHVVLRFSLSKLSLKILFLGYILHYTEATHEISQYDDSYSWLYLQ